MSAMKRTIRRGSHDGQVVCGVMLWEYERPDEGKGHRIVENQGRTR